MVSMILARARNGVIGRDGGLPWHLPADLAHFKRVTTGKTILMGRKTWESIGRPLPNRRNFVISRSTGLSCPGCEVYSSLEQALAAAQPEAGNEVIVIGGAGLYAEALPLVQRIYLTEVDADVPGDVTLPGLDLGAFREIERIAHPADSRHVYPFVFRTLERISR